MEDPQLESILKHLDVVRAKLAEPSEDARIEGLFRAIDKAGGTHTRVWCFNDGTWGARLVYQGSSFSNECEILAASSGCYTLESALTDLLTQLKERAEPKKEPEPDAEAPND